MIKKKKTYPIRIEKFCGIEYLVAENVPAYDGGKYGPIIDLDPKEMEALAARAIIENNYPIRGLEVRLFRSVVDLSLERFAGIFGLSGAGILKWEKDPTKRLELANEWMIRSFMAEKLNIKKHFVFSDAIKIEDSKVREVLAIKYKAS
jgi:DNA-binding transcriptional regulator YiaG